MSWLARLFSRRRIYSDLSAEIQEHLDERIEELIAVGVDQFNLYLMVEKPEAVIKKYGEAIIPAFS